MALSEPFSNLTNSFFLISPDEYEANFREEIWGCYKYIGIPIETIYSMPIQERKFYIQRHNLEQKREEETMRANESQTSSSKENVMDGEALNAFAQKEQEKK